jgi:hypothetical protein
MARNLFYISGKIDKKLELVNVLLMMAFTQEEKRFVEDS